jgi:hypothetical protein
MNRISLKYFSSILSCSLLFVGSVNSDEGPKGKWYSCNDKKDGYIQCEQNLYEEISASKEVKQKLLIELLSLIKNTDQKNLKKQTIDLLEAELPLIEIKVLKTVQKMRAFSNNLKSDKELYRKFLKSPKQTLQKEGLLEEGSELLLFGKKATNSDVVKLFKDLEKNKSEKSGEFTSTKSQSYARFDTKSFTFFTPSIRSETKMSVGSETSIHTVTMLPTYVLHEEHSQYRPLIKIG